MLTQYLKISPHVDDTSPYLVSTYLICGHLHLNMLVWSTSHHSWTHVISLHVDSSPPHIPTCAWLHTSTYLHLWSQHILQLVSISLHIPRCGWTPPSHISTCECHTSVFGLHISTYLHMLTLTSPHNSTFCLRKFKYKCSKLLHSCIKVKHNHTVPVILFIELVVIMTAPWAWVVDVMFHWLDFIVTFHPLLTPLDRRWE